MEPDSPAQGVQYRHAKLVLFRDSIDSACGMAQSATGPFYCPEDEKVYIDLGFYDELKQRFGAPGEFAEAYVLAHEIGHHVQKLLGIESKVRAAQQQNPQAANQLSVGLELQADCLAGVWGHSTQQRNILDPGDVDEGLKAAAAVGDDRLQRMSTGHVNPETFTHGSSAQRSSGFSAASRMAASPPATPSSNVALGCGRRILHPRILLLAILTRHKNQTLESNTRLKH